VPYRIKGTTVQVKRAGKWVTLHRHRTRAEAEAQLKAIYADVGKAHGGK
jgi:hypothetical protein